MNETDSKVQVHELNQYTLGLTFITYRAGRFPEETAQPGRVTSFPKDRKANFSEGCYFLNICVSHSPGMLWWLQQTQFPTPDLRKETRVSPPPDSRQQHLPPWPAVSQHIPVLLLQRPLTHPQLSPSPGLTSKLRRDGAYFIQGRSLIPSLIYRE